jgi:hypothetical protein
VKGVDELSIYLGRTAQGNPLPMQRISAFEDKPVRWAAAPKALTPAGVR